jgi:DNA-binding transcriptional ArsR family regulator
LESIIVKEIESAERIAKLSSIFSDPTRVKILLLLGQEPEGATTMDICTRLGLYQPRISSHLAILLKHEMVAVSESGRQRIYSVNPKVSSLLKSLSEISEPVVKRRTVLSTSREAMKEVRMNSEIRQCRSCYDHLAGVAGVKLLQDMLKLGWLLEEDQRTSGAVSKISYKLTERGSSSLRERGVDLDDAKKSKSRKFAYGCLDWTERAPHLGGSLGKAVLDSIISTGIVGRKKGTRALNTVKPISSWLRQ